MGSKELKALPSLEKDPLVPKSSAREALEKQKAEFLLHSIIKRSLQLVSLHGGAASEAARALQEEMKPSIDFVNSVLTPDEKKQIDLYLRIKNGWSTSIKNTISNEGENAFLALCRIAGDIDKKKDSRDYLLSFLKDMNEANCLNEVLSRMDEKTKDSLREKAEKYASGIDGNDPVSFMSEMERKIQKKEVGRSKMKAKEASEKTGNGKTKLQKEKENYMLLLEFVQACASPASEPMQEDLRKLEDFFAQSRNMATRSKVLPELLKNFEAQLSAEQKEMYSERLAHLHAQLGIQELEKFFQKTLQGEKKESQLQVLPTLLKTFEGALDPADKEAYAPRLRQLHAQLRKAQENTPGPDNVSPSETGPSGLPSSGERQLRFSDDASD